MQTNVLCGSSRVLLTLPNLDTNHDLLNCLFLLSFIMARIPNRKVLEGMKRTDIQKLCKVSFKLVLKSVAVFDRNTVRRTIVSVRI
jgi:hypothetical protein